MSNKFLHTISGDGNLSDGTQTIFGSTLGASNLTASSNLRTNAINQIVTSNLNISDIDNLQTTLDATISTPYSRTFEAVGVVAGTATNYVVLTSGGVVTTGNLSGVNFTASGSITGTGNIGTSADVFGVNIDASGDVSCVDIAATGSITASGDIGTSADVSAVNINVSGVVEAASYTEGGVTGKIVKIDGSRNYYANSVGIPDISGASDSTLLGFEAGKSLTTRYGNTAIGSKALHAHTTGFSNTCLGASSLAADTDGCCNSIFGYFSMQFGDGSYNSVFGRESGRYMSNSLYNVIIGSQACNTGTDERTRCVSIGYGSNTTGINCIAIGDSVNNTTNDTCIIGKSTLTSISNGGTICDLGTTSNKFKDGLFSGNLEAVTYTQAGDAVDFVKNTANDTIYFGDNAGAAIVGEAWSMFLGKNSGLSKTNGNSNVAIGNNSYTLNTTSNFNTTVGAQSMKNHTSGNGNTVMGSYSCFDATGTSSHNTVIGNSAGYNITDSSFNVFIGNDSNGNTVASRSRCVAVGNDTECVGDNCIVIGDTVDGTANECVIGNASITSISNMGDNTCDLGTSANMFKTGYLGTSLQISDNWVFDQSATQLKLNHLSSGVIDKTITLMTPTSSSNVAFRSVFGTTTASTSIYENAYLRIGYISYSGTYKLTFEVLNFPTGMTICYANSSPDHGASQKYQTNSTNTVVALTTLSSFAAVNSTFEASLIFGDVISETPHYFIKGHRGAGNIVFDIRKITDGDV